MAYVISQSLSESDLEFLADLEGRARFIHVKHVTYMLGGASLNIECKLKHRYFDEWEDNDGWRDAATGDRIASTTDRLVILDCPEESATALKLKYLDKLLEVEIQYE